MTFFFAKINMMLLIKTIESLFCQWYISLLIYIADKEGIFLFLIWTEQRMIFYNLLLLYVQKMLNFVLFYNSINRIKGHDFSFTCTYLVKKIYVNRILISLTFRSSLFVLIVALFYPKLIFHASYWCVQFIPRLPVKMKKKS